MIGLLVWDNTGKRRGRRSAQEISVMRLRLLRMGVAQGNHTPEAVLRRRIYAAEKRLKKLGVSQVILPEGFTPTEHPEGIGPVSTLPLRQALAADWVRREAAERELRDARVAVSAQRLTGEVVRTVTELTLRHRYVILDVPYGGEELCRRLRREYGVSVLLNPETAQLDAAEVLVLFDAREDLTRKNPVVLPLYDEKHPLPPLVLPPALEEKLPVGVDRSRLLAALLQSGMIRAGADLTF